MALLVALYAARSGAPPPVSAFPADLRPEQDSVVPLNARVWIFGKGAPPLSQVGVALSVDGQPASAELAALGCCGVVATPSAPFEEGDTVQVTASSAGNEATSRFSVGASADETPPTLFAPAVLDDAQGTLVLGVEGEDDVALAGFLARASGAVVGAAPPGFVLEAPAGESGCVDVVAVDLAGNESEPRRACGAAPAPDAGVPDDAGGGEPPGGCSQAPGASLWLTTLFCALALWRRRRLGGPR